jgi:signal transduction histidine kinase
LTTFRRQNAVQVSYLVTGLDGTRLDYDLETALYRIVQEALTNVARHAKAQHVGVILSRRENTVSLIIEDDGLGFDVEEALRRGRLGLLGMRERSEMLGGTLTIESSPGCGATVFVHMPAVPMQRA